MWQLCCVEIRECQTLKTTWVCECNMFVQIGNLMKLNKALTRLLLLLHKLQIYRCGIRHHSHLPLPLPLFHWEFFPASPPRTWRLLVCDFYQTPMMNTSAFEWSKYKVEKHFISSQKKLNWGSRTWKPCYTTIERRGRDSPWVISGLKDT